MIRVGDEDTPDTRRRVNPEELLVSFAARSDAEAALEAFADARLITKDRDTAAITHEALIRCWPQLRDWINVSYTSKTARMALSTCSSSSGVARPGARRGGDGVDDRSP
jgi:hypothetical protein